MTLYKWLINVMKYSDAEAEETILRYENGMDIPADVMVDIQKWAEYREKQFLEKGRC